MRMFTASMSYDLSSGTSGEARKLLSAELAGRRWKRRLRERLMPRNTIWIERSATDEQTTSDLHRICAIELRDAARAVAAAGLPIEVVRAFIQVSGAGSYGLAKEGLFDTSEPEPTG